MLSRRHYDWKSNTVISLFFHPFFILILSSDAHLISQLHCWTCGGIMHKQWCLHHLQPFSKATHQQHNQQSHIHGPATNKPWFYIGNPTVLLSTVMFPIHLKASACWGRGLRHVPIFYSVLLNTSCDCSAESIRIRWGAYRYFGDRHRR